MQLGMGDDDSDLWVPTKIKGKQLENKKVKSVSAGGQHTVLLASDASVKPATSQSSVQNGRKKAATGSEQAPDAKENTTNEKKSEDEEMDTGDN